MRYGAAIKPTRWNVTRSGQRCPSSSLLLLPLILMPGVGGLSRRVQGQSLSTSAPAANAPAPAANPTQAQFDPTIQASTRIVADAVLTVTVTDEPTLSGDFTVGAKGTIHFVISAGDGDRSDNKVEWDVMVAGKTTAEATGAVADSLKKYLKTPDVQVAIKQMPRLHIELTGPVRKTELRLPLGSRLSDALNAAGCDRDTDYSRIVLLRKEKGDGKTTPIPINLIEGKPGQGDDDPALQNGDRILLQKRPTPKPENKLQTIRIIGQVVKEGDIPVGKNETIKDALARVGGLTESADRKKIVLHRGSTGKDYELDADKIEENDPLFNIAVEPGDFIMVGRRDLTMRYAVGGAVRSGDMYNFDPSEHMTVLRAIEKAGGITKKGDTRKGILRRGFLINPLSSQDLPFDTEAIRKGKAQDWDLLPGDMVLILPKQKRPSLLQNLLPLVLRFLPFGL